MSQFGICHCTTSIIPCHFFLHGDSNQPHVNTQSFNPSIFFILVIPLKSFPFHIVYAIIWMTVPDLSSLLLRVAEPVSPKIIYLCPMSKDLWMLSYLWGQGVFADMLKILRWGHHPELPRWALNSVISVLRKDTQKTRWREHKFEWCGHKSERRGGRKWPMGQTPEWCSHKSINTNSKQNLEKTKNRFTPKAFGESSALLTSWFQTSDLWN